MNEKILRNIFEVSETFASKKRLLLLFLLKEEPMGYTMITKQFRELGIPIGSSEVYKHLKHLIAEGFIAKRRRSYILTLKGLKAVESAVDIMKTPPTLPEIKLAFKFRKSK